MTSMKVVATRNDQSVLCVFENGMQWEIEMIEARGDRLISRANVETALQLIHTHLKPTVSQRLLLEQGDLK